MYLPNGRRESYRPLTGDTEKTSAAVAGGRLGQHSGLDEPLSGRKRLHRCISRLRVSQRTVRTNEANYLNGRRT